MDKRLKRELGWRWRARRELLIWRLEVKGRFAWLGALLQRIRFAWAMVARRNKSVVYNVHLYGAVDPEHENGILVDSCKLSPYEHLDPETVHAIGVYTKAPESTEGNGQGHAE